VKHLKRSEAAVSVRTTTKVKDREMFDVDIETSTQVICILKPLLSIHNNVA